MYDSTSRFESIVVSSGKNTYSSCDE